MNSHAFIFDMDGVLIDSNPYHKIALNQFCAKHGHYLTDEQLLNKVYGRTNKEWLTNLFGPLPEATIHAYAEEKEALYRQLLEHDIKPVNGLLPFLDLLDKYDIARAIGTSAPQSNVAFTLSKTHTERYFSTILKGPCAISQLIVNFCAAYTGRAERLRKAKIKADFIQNSPR